MPILFIDDNKGIIYSETAAILFITPKALKEGCYNLTYQSDLTKKCNIKIINNLQ